MTDKLPVARVPSRPDDRLDRERDFHNRIFAESTRESALKFYSVIGRSEHWYNRQIIRQPPPGRVLEVGCGPRARAAELAKLGFDVSAIDISDTAIQMARATASEKGILGVDFRVMNAESLDYPDAAFDLILGSAVLHHLDLDKAGPELARVMKPGGRGIFIEPLGHNPLINWYRRRTPHLRSADEHPLLIPDLKGIRNNFQDVDVRYFEFSTIAAVAARRTRLFRPALAVLGAIDAFILGRFSPLRRWSWICVIAISTPR
ncbi:MAG: class I SAM-dependent methyltransferase [Candidatus Dormibacteria bacterium]